jgi:hypothetical protein
MNKVNQLSAQERQDIFLLLEVLQCRPSQEREVVRILPRQFQNGYLDLWSQATGGTNKELARFFRGSVSHLCLPRVSLANLDSDSTALIFAALFQKSFWLDEFIQTDVMETFYVIQGHLELIACLHKEDLRFTLCAGEVNQVCPGTPYRIFAELGTQVIVVHQPLRDEASWGTWLGSNELKGLLPPLRVRRRRMDEGGRSGTA